MNIYLDKDYKCHVEAADGLAAFETDYFDGKCKAYIEGYRIVPEGHTWTREDGEVFEGEMYAPWKDSEILEAAQEQYEEMLAEMQDMQAALLLLEVTPTEEAEEVQDNG